MTANVHIESLDREVSYSDRGSNYQPYQQRVIIDCGCGPRYVDSAPFNHTSKETKVTQKFDTTPEKNTALTAIEKSVQQLERALYSRTEARALVEADHNKRIASASIELDRVVAESLQAGITEEDFENYLPDYDAELSERLNEVRNVISLANVLEGV